MYNHIILDRYDEALKTGVLSWDAEQIKQGGAKNEQKSYYLFFKGR